MAELDTSIPLGIKVPEYDPMGDAYKIAQIRNAQQSYQANNLALEENRRKLQEQTSLRNMLASGIDPLSPEGQRQAFMIAPNLGPTFVKTALEAQKADREARSSDLKYTQDMVGHHRELLPLVTDENSYNIWRASAVKDLPKLAEAIPTEYSADNVKRLMANSAKMLENEVKSINVQNPDGTITEKFISIPKTGIGAPSEIYSSTNAPQGAVRTDEQGKQWLRIGGVEYPVAESSTPAAEAIKRAIPSNAATAGAPFGAAAGSQTFNSAAPNVPTMAQPRVPLSQAFDPVAYDRAVRGAEGTTKNPNSSANGLYQFTDGTFVNTFKKVFPEAKDMSNNQILAMRGSKLPDGKTVEEVMGPAFTAQNVQYLQSKGLPVTGATAYLAHFLGTGGAEKLLKADPNTPVSQVVSQDAIDANKSILQGKTVGQVQQWAANLIDRKGGTIGTASGALPAFSQPQAGPTFAQPGATGGAVTGGGAVTSGGYVPPQIGLNALAPQQQPAQNALLQQNQPVAPQITPYQMQINNAPAQPVAGVEPFKQAGTGSKAAQKIEEAVATAQGKQAAADIGRPEFDSSLNAIIDQYKKLGEKGMLIGKETSLGNRAAAIASNVSPEATTLFSPERGANVEAAKNIRQTMLSALMSATGMSSKQIDSNAEMSAYLNSLSNPGQHVEAIVDTLNNLSRRFGTGKTLRIEDLTGNVAQNPKDTSSVTTRRNQNTQQPPLSSFYR